MLEAQPNSQDYDMNEYTGVEKYNHAMNKWRTHMLEETVKCVKDASYFSEVILNHKLFPYNKKYVNDDKNRWIIYRCGRKVGKSTSVAVKALHRAWFADAYFDKVVDLCDILIVAPTLYQANVIMDQIKTFSKRSKLYEDSIIRETATELEIEWLSGNGKTRIFTRAAGDTGTSLRGYIPHIIIVDEAAFINQRVLVALIPAAMGQKAHIWITSTPFGKNNYFYEKSVDANSMNPRWKEYHVKSLENPEIANDPHMVAEIKSVTGDEFTQEFEGEFLDGGNALIPRHLIQEAIVESVKIPDSSRYYLGVDVARTGRDETVFCLIAVDNNDKVHVVKTFNESQTDISYMVDRIGHWCRDYPIQEVFLDETGLGAGAIDVARARGIDVTGILFNIKSKEEMFTTLRMLFENKRIKMTWEDKMIHQLSYLKREYINGRMRVLVDAGLHDDYADALALACKAVATGDRWEVLKPIPHMFG